MNIRKPIVFFSLMLTAAVFILYACAQTQQGAPSSPQTAAQTPTPPPAPVVQQAPPGMDFHSYSGDLSDPNGFPAPGAPYARQNSDPPTALRGLPTDSLGLPNWVTAGGMSRESGEALYKMDKDASVIHPRDDLKGEKKPTPPFNFNVEIPAVGAMPNVIFPHFPHTYWLDCANCHPSIFIMKKGANPISMVKITNGEYCGRCHGRVAFPLAECNRCHVKPKP